MSRPRSMDKSVPVSVAIPTSLVMKLENHLDYSQSRSKWICRAIESKLLGMESNGIETASTWQLMAALSLRPEVDKTLKQLLINSVMENQRKTFEDKKKS